MGGGDPLDELMASLQRLGRLFASRQVTARITTAAGAEVTQQGATLLRALLRGGEQQSVAELAQSAAMDLGAVSRQVRLLEAAEAVRRLRSPDDGRVALLELTVEGRNTAERIKEAGARHLEGALRDWSDADRRALADLMGRLVDDMVATPIR